MEAELFGVRRGAKQQLPLFLSPVRAGFPSPADDYIEQQLDLNELVVRHPAATFYVRVRGDSMLGAGIHPGDILVVDRALQPACGSVVVAVLDGEMTVKRLGKSRGRPVLHAENPEYPDIPIPDGEGFEIWGVVSYVLHRP